MKSRRGNDGSYGELCLLLILFAYYQERENWGWGRRWINGWMMNDTVGMNQ